MKTPKPVNGHLLIEPVKHEEFVVTDRAVYEEIGIILDVADDVISGLYNGESLNLIGNKVYFDSWLAAKYPVEGGKEGEFYWLVKWEDVRATEYDIKTLPE